jgi:cell division protein FtsW (lipid II flippase)
LLGQEIYARQYHRVTIAMNIGLMPIKGFTLPLISYGGSSMIFTIIALALLLRIDMLLSQKSYRYEALVILCIFECQSLILCQTKPLYGGSSMIFTIIALALLLRIDMENRADYSKRKSYV